MISFSGMKTNIILLLISILILTACQSGGETFTEENYRSSFTVEEKEKGMASFELMKDVKVDAELTPVSQYKDGLKKYYLRNYYETEQKMSKEEFLENPTLYRRKYSEMQELFADEMDGTIKGRTDTDQEDFMMTWYLKKKNGSLYEVYSTWEEGGTWPDDEGRISCPDLHVFSVGGEGIDEMILSAYNVILFDHDFENAATPFLDQKTTGKNLREFLQKLLGRELYEEWDCIPITKETVDGVNQALGYIPGTEEYKNPPEEEYCLYMFPASVAGLPYVETRLTYHMKEGETASEKARAGTTETSSTLDGLGQRTQYVAFSSKGIIGMDLSYYWQPEEVYKDSAAVLDPDEILAKVKEFYERQLVTTKETITGISLIYTGYFTDGSEGEIQPTVAPFWYVSTVGEDHHDNRSFYYDAFTGELVGTE